MPLNFGPWHDKTSGIFFEAEPSYTAGYQAMEELIMSCNMHDGWEINSRSCIGVVAWTLDYKDGSQRHFVHIEVIGQ